MTSRFIGITSLALAAALFGTSLALEPATADPAVTCLTRPAAPLALVMDDAVALPECSALLGMGSLELVPALVTGSDHPDLVLAQRAITRTLPKEGPPTTPGEPYTYVEVPGWKSPSQAAALSFVVPGTGQLYTGSNRGYLFLGFEAIALLTYAKFRGDRDHKREEYFHYVGDPTVSDSRFSFDRLAGSVDAGELARLRSIYEKDPREFYDLVSTSDRYLGGWTTNEGNVAGTRGVAQDLSDETNRLGQRARIGLFAAIANHLVSAADALRLARFNNIALQDNLSLKIRLKPGSRGKYSATLTRKF